MYETFSKVSIKTSVCSSISCGYVQDLQKCRDVLLGSMSGQQTDLNLPCPGMFQERKQSNFFQVVVPFSSNHS